MSAAVPKPSTHPLEHSWTLWYDSKKTVAGKGGKDASPTAGADKKPPAASENWEENLVQVDSMNSVEQFWVTTNQIKKPSNLELGANYHFFKKGIKPMWEDPANTKGGKWVFSLQSKEDLYRVDAIWEELLMAMIGEYLDEGSAGDHVVGAVLSRKRNAFRVSLWTKDAEAKEANDILGPKAAEIMKVDPKKVSLVYLAHGAGYAPSAQ